MEPETAAKWLALFQSHRIATSVLLTFVIAVGIVAGCASLLHEPIAHLLTQVPDLKSAPVLIFGGSVLLIVSYAAAHFVYEGLDRLLFRRIQRWAARRHEKAQAAKERQERERVGAEQRQRAEAKLQSILPDLAPEYRSVLELFHLPEPRNVQLPLGHINASGLGELVYALQREGFLELVSLLAGGQALYRLSPVAETLVPAFFAEQRKQAVIQAVKAATPHERVALELFCTPISADRYEHPHLDYAVYAAIGRLEQRGVLTRIRGREDTERMTLAELANPHVAELIGRPVVRSSITIDLRRVAGTGSSGTGATGSPTFPRQRHGNSTRN